MTWHEHKKLAAIMGGDLACITNAHENEQVRRMRVERLFGLEEFVKVVVMDLDQIIGNGPTVRTGPTLIGEQENPTTTQNMMKTE